MVGNMLKALVFVSAVFGTMAEGTDGDYGTVIGIDLGTTYSWSVFY